METVVLVIHILSAAALVIVILVQRSEGGALSGLSGGGGGSGVLSARGAANALSRVTAVFAIIFMGSALYLASISTKANKSAVAEKIETPAVITEPQDANVPLAK